MTQTASREESIAAGADGMLVAFELGWKNWKVGFAAVMGEKPWVVAIRPRGI